jgi:hypothetical protein
VAQTDGGDIIFTAGDGVTKLDHEIEKYDETTGELVAWVEVNSLSGTNNTDIYIYYGNTSLAEGENQWNPLGVWDSNYVGVWHLKETPTVDPLAYDSTSNDNDASFLADMTSGDQVGGQIDGAMDFDDAGSNDRVRADDDPSLGGMSGLTVETWVNLKQTVPQVGDNSQSYYLSYKSHSGAPWFSWQLMAPDWDPGFYLEVNTDGVSGSVHGNTVASADTWYHIVGVYESGQPLKLYVNGGDDSKWPDTPSGNVLDSDQPYYMGGDVNGILDEFRISKVARSAAWIETEYNNQRAPAAFYTVGIEETSGTGADPFNNGWIYRKRITIDSAKVACDLTNFPVLISTTDPDLTAAQANFNDILFTAADGATKLDHEIEDYDQGTGKLVAWVEVRALSGTANTDLYLYYGNGNAVDQRNPTGAGVWEPNYVGVWHLEEPVINEQTSGTHEDSTYNDIDGTQVGNEGVTGKIAGGQNFDGSDDEVRFSDAIIGGRAAWTLTAWMKTASSAKQTIYGEGDLSTGNYLYIDKESNSYVEFYVENGPDWALFNGSTNVEDNQFHHVA